MDPTVADVVIVDASQLFYHVVWPHGGSPSDWLPPPRFAFRTIHVALIKSLSSTSTKMCLPKITRGFGNLVTLSLTMICQSQVLCPNEMQYWKARVEVGKHPVLMRMWQCRVNFEAKLQVFFVNINFGAKMSILCEKFWNFGRNVDFFIRCALLLKVIIFLQHVQNLLKKIKFLRIC